MELGSIVDAQLARLAGHRPFALDTAQREPGRFIHCDVRQAQSDRGCDPAWKIDPVEG
jgi:hypothetical protein